MSVCRFIQNVNGDNKASIIESIEFSIKIVIVSSTEISSLQIQDKGCCIPSCRTVAGSWSGWSCTVHDIYSRGSNLLMFLSEFDSWSMARLFYPQLQLHCQHWQLQVQLPYSCTWKWKWGRPGRWCSNSSFSFFFLVKSLSFDMIELILDFDVKSLSYIHPVLITCDCFNEK